MDAASIRTWVRSTAVTPGARAVRLEIDDVQLGHIAGRSFAQQPRARDGSLQQLVPVAAELPPSTVDAGEQQRRSAGGLLELEAQLKTLSVDAVGADREHGRLPHPGQALVNRADRQVGALRQRALG